MIKRLLRDIGSVIKGAFIPCLAAVVIGVIVFPVYSKWKEQAQLTTCLSNLRLIGIATSMYLEDNDDTFPAAWSGCVDGNGWEFQPWQYALEPYTRAGVIDRGDWASSGGDLWHCPADDYGENISYGANAMIAGAYPYIDCSQDLRGPMWQDSKKLSDIHDPKTVVWAGDTNKTWDPSRNRYTEVMEDWIRRTDGPLLHKNLTAVKVWYADYLKSDYTDYRGICPDPGLYGCKAPAYRHDRHGPGSGRAGMLFCDGHAKAIPFGGLTVANIFPNEPASGVLVGAAQAGNGERVHGSGEEQHSPAYRITDLGSLGGGWIYHGWAGMNDTGDVVGASLTADNHIDAFLWKKNQMADLASWVDSGSGTAMSINDSDQIVGTEGGQAVLWQKGRMISLGALPGYASGWAYSVSENGLIAGYASSPDTVKPNVPVAQAFLYRNGHMIGLGVLSGCSTSHANAINNNGDVAGWGLDSHHHMHAFLWKNGHMIDIAATFGNAMSEAMAINNHGHVVGDEGKSADDIHAFFWSDGHLQDLKTLPGCTYMKATAINDLDQVVGNVQVLSEPVAPFVWDRAQGMRSLGDLIPKDSGWYLTKAFAVNNQGQILCFGSHNGQKDQLCLLTPTRSI